MDKLVLETSQDFNSLDVSKIVVSRNTRKDREVQDGVDIFLQFNHLLPHLHTFPDLRQERQSNIQAMSDVRVKHYHFKEVHEDDGNDKIPWWRTMEDHVYWTSFVMIIIML